MDPAALKQVEVFPGVRSSDAHGFPSAGAYGCFQGHLGILRKARSMQLRSVFILEDDLCFEPTWRRDWVKIEGELGMRSWDILNLGFRSRDTRKVTGRSELVRSDEQLMLAHCYAVNGPALPRLIDFLEMLETRPFGDPRGGPMHYDGALFHFCNDAGGVVRLRPRRSLAGQRSSRSDIAERRWYHRTLSAMRPITSLVRRLRNSAA